VPQAVGHEATVRLEVGRQPVRLDAAATGCVDHADVHDGRVPLATADAGRGGRHVREGWADLMAADVQMIPVRHIECGETAALLRWMPQPDEILGSALVAHLDGTPVTDGEEMLCGSCGTGFAGIGRGPDGQPVAG
jgi:hypothetical protein